MRIRLNLENFEEHSGIDEATSEDLAFPTLFGGGTASLSPFQRSPRSAYGSLPPLLGQDLNSCPATKGTYPLGTPKHRSSKTMFTFEGTRRSRARGLFEKAQDSGFRKHATFAPASQKRLGFRLRSPHLFGEEPCP
ncbi:MAG: hypothetical protein JSV46_02690, partial [Candidatus Aminicenantes bacterium]